MKIRYEITYDNNLRVMDMFDAFVKIPGVKPYHHNISNRVIGVEIPEKELDSIREIKGILSILEDPVMR